MKPSFRNLFMKKFTRDRVVPTISASISIAEESDLPGLSIRSSRSIFVAHSSGDSVVMADIRIRIPMAAGFRSLNIAVSTGIAVAEALRQTGKFPQ